MLNKKIILGTALISNIAFANIDAELESLKTRIYKLENKLQNNNIVNNKFSSRKILNNQFNPSIGIVLNGKYNTFSRDESEIAGFAIGHEGERGKENFSIGESEINFSSNIDDKFYGSLTAAIVKEDGEDKIELEEAYIKTRPEFGLPTSMEIKIGRAFWNVGYLNEHHVHTDDFADRPLPYRVFLNKSFNDDGAQISYVLPTKLYTEIGGAMFRGDDFPFGNGDGAGSYSAYLRVGGDLSKNQNLRFGASVLSGEAKNAGRINEEGVSFIGDTKLYIADFRYNFAPTGNTKSQELTLQGEYFYRQEVGTYEVTTNNRIDFDDNNSGWYFQTVYKFSPAFRVGARYSKLIATNAPSRLANTILDSEGYKPRAYSVMTDWTNSEFSRIRLQYNHEELAKNKIDNQFTLQYVVSFGAHTAHKY